MKTELELLSDRHFRQDPDGILKQKEDARSGRVLVTIDPLIASTIAGQHLAWMLINLISRQFGLVVEIVIDAPDTDLLANTAGFGQASSLRETLINCVQLVSGSHVKVKHALTSSEHIDIHLVLGSQTTSIKAKDAWFIYADGWRWYVGRTADFPQTSPTSHISIGPYIAACYASGEVFKLLRGMLPNKGEHINNFCGSAWTMSSDSAKWEDLDDGPMSEEFPKINHAYLAGAGAVAQAVILTLASSEVEGNFTAVDHDQLDITNDNRYVLSQVLNDGELKVSLLSKYLHNKKLTCVEVPCKWEEHVSNCGRKTLDKEIAELERQFRYPLVISCVDENSARHAIQNIVPKLILGGSTDGLTAKSTVYEFAKRDHCLKCFNPVRERNAIVKEKLELARKMTEDEQKQFCQESEITLEELRKLLHASKCGQLNEADIERFAKGPPEMSVGFVSVASGVLLAAQLIRTLILGANETTKNGNTAIATFSRARLRQITLANDAMCNCKDLLKKRWSGFWS